jgi:hypothetical protein
MDATPDHDETLAWLLGLATGVLDAAVQRGSVPSIERQRGRRPRDQRLAIEQQREIAMLRRFMGDSACEHSATHNEP